jgi:alginate O-acetyltransferase complex protein AlgI
MVFSEPSFLFVFLPILLGLYFLAPRNVGFRNGLLLLASLVFYAWGERSFVFVLLVSVTFNYAMGRLIGAMREGPRGRLSIAIGIGGNLLLLGAYKYANFVADNLNVVLSGLHLRQIEIPRIPLPIGISFFTFHSLSYLIDVYRGQFPAQRNVLDIGVYITLFPQLIAGPIVRYKDIAAQIARRVVSGASFRYGVRRFIIGLGKKVLIANSVAWPADQIFAIPAQQLTSGLACFGVLSYTLQIYFDFSGYSDMAIGLGRMFGLEFRENFNYPYVAASVTEFWRRWHVSLSTWFRDYLYVPLGGNRVGPLRVYANLLTVFFLCGLWHGASWTFVVWGLFHGAFLVLERAGWMRRLTSRPALSRVYTMGVVMVGWIFFRAPSLRQGLAILKAALGGAQGTGVEYHISMYLDNQVALAILAGVIGSFPVAQLLSLWVDRQRSREGGTGAVFEITYAGMVTVFLGGVLLASLVIAAAGMYNPFIYYRF